MFNNKHMLFRGKNNATPCQVFHSAPFLTLGTHRVYIPTFPFLHHISRMMGTSFPAPLCSIYLRLACPVRSPNICLVYLYTGHIYQYVLPSIFGCLYNFHRFFMPPVCFFQYNFLSGTYICFWIEVRRVPALPPSWLAHLQSHFV